MKHQIETMQRTTTGRKRRLGSVVLRISSKGYENEELRARKRAECGWASPGYQPYRPLGTPDLDRKKPLQADTNSASGLLLAPSTDSSGGSKISSSHVPGAGKKHGEGKGIFGSLQYRVGYVRGNGYKELKDEVSKSDVRKRECRSGRSFHECIGHVDNEAKVKSALRLPKLSPLYLNTGAGGSSVPGNVSSSHQSPIGGGGYGAAHSASSHRGSLPSIGAESSTSSPGVRGKNQVGVDSPGDGGGPGIRIDSGLGSIFQQQQQQMPSQQQHATNVGAATAAGASGGSASAAGVHGGSAGGGSSVVEGGPGLSAAGPQQQPGAVRLADQLRSFDVLRGNLNDRLRHRLENMRCGREESYKAKFNAFHVQVQGCADFNGNRWRRDAEDSKRGARERIVESHPWFGKLCATAGYEKGKLGPEMQVVGSVRTVIEKKGDFEQGDFRVLVESLPPESIARTGVQKIVSFIRDGLRIGFKDLSRGSLPSLKKQSISVQQSLGAQEKLAKLSPRLPRLVL